MSDCVITTACGDATSAASTLSVCPVDFDYDGFVTGFEAGC